MSTMHLQGRTVDLHIYGPPPLKEIIDIQLLYSETRLRYKVHFHPLNAAQSEVIYDDDSITISTIILSHRIPCTGFLFSEKQGLRKLIKEKLHEYKIPIAAYQDLKNGEDFISDGKTIPNRELTMPARKARTYAFCSDTRYDEKIISHIQNVDLLYHEATFLNDKIERAHETFHSTAGEAATIALKAGVKRLIIGHFSARYKNLYPLLEEAREVFPDTTLAIEGDSFRIDENG
jgi:ribonuclease Z